MAVIQVAYEVPAEIATGLLDGTLSRFGSVVRNDKQIIKHLKEVDLPETDSAQKSVAEVLAENKGAVIGTIVVIGGIIIGTTVAAVIAHKKKKTQSEMPECVVQFKKALADYSEALKSGSMSVEVIDSLISALDELKKNENDNNIVIDFSSSEFATLVDMILDYTQKLADANSVKIDAENDEAEQGNILSLRKYLSIQKQIFDQAA